jgi:hypothetical protein
MQSRLSFGLLTLLFGTCFTSLSVSVANAAPLPPGFSIGSANVAIADPAVPRPSTQPCSVVLFSNQQFANFNTDSFNYAPPATCSGPWSKVVLEVDLSINAGVQYDRTAHIWLGGVNIYTGTTEEPDSVITRNWHVERDVTDYSALFNSAQSGTVDLGNLVNSTYTGILTGTATLQFYPAVPGIQPERTPDNVYAMSASATGGAVTLNTTTDQLTQTITFPANVERAFVDVLAQGQSGDEFWYTCVPNSLVSQLESCGNTPFREAEVTIDGQPAGVAPVYPWIFTGGVDPFLWRPTPGVQTLNLLPYRVDISPFAGQLSNGKPHTLAISVYNANGYFLASGAVLTYLDHHAKHVTGGIISNTLAAAVAPTINNQIATDSSGNVSGFVTTSSKRNFKIAGYVQTSHGRVDMVVRQDMNYTNKQVFTINAADYIQNISQETNVDTDTGIYSNVGEVHEHHTVKYPLTMDISYIAPAGQAAAQTTTVSQAYDAWNSLAVNGWPVYSSEVHNQVNPADTINFDASGNFTGNTAQSSTQKFSFRDTIGSCYDRVVESKTGVLTSVTDGAQCRGHHNSVRWFVDPYGIELPDLWVLNMLR